MIVMAFTVFVSVAPPTPYDANGGKAVQLSIAPRAKDVLDEISALEIHAASQTLLLDKLADLHNDLTDWATNTPHEEAALEVMGILEMYVQKTKEKDNGDQHQAPGKACHTQEQGSEEALPAG